MPAYHFGIWQIQQPRAVVTWETKNQSPAELKVINILLFAVKHPVIPKIIVLLTHYTPKQLEHQ
jgi:hypothetical protein